MLNFRRSIFILAFVAALAIFIAIGAWTGHGNSRRETGPALRSGAAAPPKVSGMPRAEVTRNVLPSDLSVTSRPASAGGPVAAMGYVELVKDSAFLRQERRRFEAQKWEVDLTKALELPANVPLERRSGFYQVPGFQYPLVRVDRVYRMDRPGVAAATSAHAAANASGASPMAEQSALPVSGEASVGSRANDAPAGSPAIASARRGSVGLLDAAGGGEVVWENAMVADHIMVQVESGVTREQLQWALPARTQVREAITTRGLYLVAVPVDGERSIERAVLALSGLRGVVQFAEPDFLTAGADTTPDDPLFTASVNDISKQWHLARIMAPRAWDVVKAPKNATVANQTVVAVVDTGVDYSHPDLAGNLWINPGESGGGKETNGIDDDGNGKVDDWRGWNFVEANNNVMDDVGHGTHVAGLVGAIGNNATGGSGVCWGVKILPLRIIKAQGTGTFGTYSAAIAALDYIRVLNVTGRQVAVANHSWGGNGYSLAMLNAINNPVATTDALPTGLTSSYLADVNTVTVVGNAAQINRVKVGMTVASAGVPIDTVVTIVNGSTMTLSNYTTTARSNAAWTFSNPIRAKSYGVAHVAAAGNSRLNVDRIPVYPACLPSGFIVSVAATDANDDEAVWSGGAGTNFGRLNVDIFAPGSSIWSTKWKLAGDASWGYESRNGTSMAAPQVAGALALMRMWQPNLTELQARQVLIEQSDAVSALSTKCVSGGRLNIAKVIDRLYQPILVGSGGGTGGGGDSTNPLSGELGLTGQVAVSHSGYQVHVLAINQGSLLGWGYSYGGQLAGNYLSGSGEFQEQASYRPVRIAGMEDCRMVAARGDGSYALRSDGTVWMWGGGDGSGGNNNTPAPIPGLTDVAWIAAQCAVKADGTVWSFVDSHTPPAQVAFPAGVNIVMVADGDSHRVALDSEGHVWAWGSQLSGQLGNGQSFGSIQTPSMVQTGLSANPQPLANIRYVAAGGSDSYAVMNDGGVYYWGQPPGTPRALEPTLVPGLQGIASIAAGTRNAVAVTVDGQVLAWGRGYTGQLGSGGESLTPVFAPSLVQLPRDVGAALSCSTGGFVGGTVAIKTENDTVFCWGDNQFGALGQGEGQLRALPTRIAPPGSFVELFAGDYSGFVRNGASRLYGWGTVQNNGPNSPADLYGQSPTLLSTYPDFIKIDTSFNRRIGLASNRQVWTWGAAPMQVAGLADAVDVAAAGGSDAFFLAVLSDGTVWSWGENESGQLGDGTTTDRVTPAQIPLLAGIRAVSAATPNSVDPIRSFAFAIKQSDGSVLAWGFNEEGQLGNGTTTSTTTPVPTLGLTNVSQIAGTTGGNFALKADGTVWAWSGSFGLTPQRVAGLPPIVRMAAAAPLFIGSDGRIWVLGPGIGPTEAGPFPKPVVGLSEVVRVENTNGCIHALRADGSLWVWGQGLIGVGSMGDGLAWSNLPLPVIGLGGTSTTLSTLGTGNTSDSWQLQYFSLAELLDDALVADTASPAGDGVSNLVKYALGLNPRQSVNASSLPRGRVDLIGGSAQSVGLPLGSGLFSVPTVELQSGKRYLALSVPRNGVHLDVDYIVEVSDDLSIWRSGDPHTVTVLDTAEWLEVYSAMSLEDVSRQFMRLKIRRK